MGAALVLVGWILQAMALDRGSVTVIEPIFSMTVVFVLPLGWWLTAQTVTLKHALRACVVVLGLMLFITFGNPAGGRANAPNWEWLVAIVLVALLCGGLMWAGREDQPTVRAGTYGAVSGLLAGLLCGTLTKPTVELLHSRGLAAVLGNWMVYALALAGLLAVLYQQVALQTGRLAPSVATGSVANPLIGVILGIVLLEQFLSPPTWHKVVALSALGCALAAAAAIALS